jgi:hypothetical protein
MGVSKVKPSKIAADIGISVLKFQTIYNGSEHVSIHAT